MARQANGATGREANGSTGRGRGDDTVTAMPEGLDLREVERELCRLPEVNAARIVEDEVGRPVEVHILASRDKHAKQIVRDVQSVAMATFGLELDRRVVSVVQLEPGPDEAGQAVAAAIRGGAPASHPRLCIDGITAEKHGLRTQVRVTLRWGDEDGTGTAEGSIATSARHRLVAAATLEAVRHLVPAAVCADVDTATVVRVGQRDVAVVNVVFVNPPIEEIVSGSAVVRETGEQEAVARAVLDALNRRLPRLASP
jgi:hypothetical protein